MRNIKYWYAKRCALLDAPLTIYHTGQILKLIMNSKYKITMITMMLRRSILKNSFQLNMVSPL